MYRGIVQHKDHFISPLAHTRRYIRTLCLIFCTGVFNKHCLFMNSQRVMNLSYPIKRLSKGLFLPRFATTFLQKKEKKTHWGQRNLKNILICPSVHPAIHPFIHPSLCLFVRLSLRPFSIYFSVHLSTSLFICLIVCYF